jgi:hypothetical protein
VAHSSSTTNANLTRKFPSNDMPEDQYTEKGIFGSSRVVARLRNLFGDAGTVGQTASFRQTAPVSVSVAL